jgi:hypothetical protein
VALAALAAALALAAVVSVRVANARWHLRARDASIPVGERRVVLPAQPMSSDWTAKPGGYRGVTYVPPPRKGVITFDPSRDRGPDVRVVPGHKALALVIRMGPSRWALVRVDGAREDDHVIVRAFACQPASADPNWQEGLESSLVPFLDGLLYELTGLRPE